MKTSSVAVIPNWMVTVFWTAVIGSVVTGTVAFATRLSATSHDHETRISVMEDHTKGVDRSLDEIKAGQLRIEDKLDRSLRSHDGTRPAH